MSMSPLSIALIGTGSIFIIAGVKGITPRKVIVETLTEVKTPGAAVTPWPHATGSWQADLTARGQAAGQFAANAVQQGAQGYTRPTV